MNHVSPQDWATLESIERGQCAALEAEAAARLRQCGLIEAKAEDRYALTPQGWHALRQHRRLDPD